MQKRSRTRAAYSSRQKTPRLISTKTLVYVAEYSHLETPSGTRIMWRRYSTPICVLDQALSIPVGCKGNHNRRPTARISFNVWFGPWDLVIVRFLVIPIVKKNAGVMVIHVTGDRNGNFRLRMPSSGIHEKLSASVLSVSFFTTMVNEKEEITQCTTAPPQHLPLDGGQETRFGECNSP